jgi:outer membrane protein
MTMRKLMMNAGFLMLALFCTVTLAAQKFGYLDSQTLLAELPKVKQANAEMETYQKELQQKYQDRVKTFQATAQDLQKRIDEGTITPKQQEEEGKKLEEERQKILASEQEMNQLLREKRETLLKPILEEVNATVKTVATEGGYTYIFDRGILLHFDSSMDVAPLVKKKLGIAQ